MFSDKSALLAQINSVIQNKSFSESDKSFDFLTDHHSAVEPGNGKTKKIYAHTNNRELLNKMQKRIEDLEEHGDHLLYFVHFLFQNLTELVKNILETNTGAEQCPVDNANEHCSKPIKACTAKKEKLSLTKREMDVFNLLIKGLCAKEIANRLFISETTVITHKKHLKEKFNARNTAEFISKAIALNNEKTKDDD